MMLAVFTAAASGADDPDPEALLKGKGLRRVYPYFSLPEETQLGKLIREAARLKRGVLDSHRVLAASEQKVQQKQELIVAYLQKRRELRAQLANTTSVQMNNRLVIGLNELADRITLMQKSGREEEALKTARAKAASQTEMYVENILTGAELFETVTEKYKDLAADATITAAVAQYAKTAGKTYKLGPTASFLSHGRTLKKLQETVLSESIPLRKSGSDLWYVSAVFGKEHTVEMALDTGASLVVLPWKTAVAVGLTPTSQDRTLELTLADGRTVEAKEKFAETLRVGKFVVEKVRCAVMPQELTHAPPLLGQSFLKHFTYKIDPANGKLVMSKVETPESGGRSRSKRTR